MFALTHALTASIETLSQLPRRKIRWFWNASMEMAAESSNYYLGALGRNWEPCHPPQRTQCFPHAVTILQMIPQRMVNPQQGAPIHPIRL